MITPLNRLIYKTENVANTVFGQTYTIHVIFSQVLKYINTVLSAH